MSDDAAPETVASTTSVPPGESPPPPASFRLGRVLALVVPIALLLAGAAWFFGYVDGPELVREWLLPPRVHAEGQIFFNDEPLAGGEIWTRPVAYPNHSTVGFIDPDGRFQLKMDIRGRYEDGALVGEHQVLIFKNDPNSPGGARAPDLLTPPRYAQFSTSPLRLTVDRDPTRNRYEFRLEKQEPSPAQDAKQEPNDGSPKPSPAEPPTADAPPAETPPATPPADDAPSDGEAAKAAPSRE